MFLLRRPSRSALERFVRDARELPLSYSPIGLAMADSQGGIVDEEIVAIGRGRADFDRAKDALGAWQQFGVGWVELFPAGASLERGTDVAVLIRHLGFWSLNGCRVVYPLDGGNGGLRFGFAYGTLTTHAESGEELFEVFMNPDSDEVLYRIRAVSRPHALLARLGYPYTRSLQARFRRDSIEAMKRVIAAAHSTARAGSPGRS
jgi:uncharacterized protein (UPF0548 family)